MTRVAPILDSTRNAAVQRDADLELVEPLRRGEASATERLVARYGDLAYRLAIRLCGREEDAEEVVQDAFWAVIRKVDTFRGEAAFGSWFYRIVANAAILKVRGASRSCWTRHRPSSTNEGDTSRRSATGPAASPTRLLGPNCAWP